MKKLHWLAILMMAVLIAITGFQVYWLRDNYNREQKAVEVKAQAIFRETVREVQDEILQDKLAKVIKDTTIAGLKRKVFNGRLNARPGPPRVARVLQILGEQLEVDSTNRKKGVFITFNSKAEFGKKDPTGGFDSLRPQAIDEVIIMKAGEDEKVKLRFDSLFSDPGSVEKLTRALAKKMDDQQLKVPFTIRQSQQTEFRRENEDFMTLPDAFGSFEGYQLQLGKSFSYLIKKISLPILFSVVLVGLTILSFVLLYRSLLRQHRLAEMKNDLISNITHELKTPIATVGVAIEALKNFNAMQDPRRTKEYLDISQNELSRLSLLVDKVLKLSMFENKEIAIKKELFDLEEVVNEVAGSLRLQLEKNKATIHVNAQGNLLAEGDRLHMVSVVFNLLDNALKYNNGQVTIRADIQEDNENIILKVTDDGIGIPQAYQHKIFEKFFRVPSGDTHNAKGHGLGLSYVARVVRQHKGTIRVESQEAHGSSFIITLPKPATSNG